MIWIILGTLAICTLAITFTTTFAVGLQEASDPDHAKPGDLSVLEKTIVERDDVDTRA